MTTITDISNNLIYTKMAYDESKKIAEDLHDEFSIKRKALSHLSFDDRCWRIYQDAICLVDARDTSQVCKKKYDRAHYLTGSHIKSVKITKTKMKSKHPEMCGICMENHTYRETISTSCNHHYGKKCFSKWIRSCFIGFRVGSCALCREENAQLFGYSEKNRFFR